MTCLGCLLIDSAPVKLRGGETVCNECPAWRLECEARHVLSMPFESRRKYLDEVEKKRGLEKTNELREEVRAIFNLAGAVGTRPAVQRPEAA